MDMECVWCVFLLVCCWSGALGTNTVGFPTLSEILDPQGDEDPLRDNAQWLFPNMTFTCTGTITAWVFRVRSGSCENTFGQFEVWRPDRANPGVYTFVNNTAITEPEQVADDVYQEVLESPIKVKENDTLGILVTSSNCRLSVLDVDTRAPAAYFRNDDVGNPIFILDLARETREIIPLITPVISVSEGFPATSSTTRAGSTLSYPEPTPTNPLLIATYSLRSSTTRASSTLSYPEPTPTNPILLPTTENTVQITSTVTLTSDCSFPSSPPSKLIVVGISAGVGAFLAIVVIFTCATILTFKVKSRKASQGNLSALGQRSKLETNSNTSPVIEDFDINMNEAYGTPHASLRAVSEPRHISTIHNEAYGASQTGQTAVMDDGLYMNSETKYDEPRF